MSKQITQIILFINVILFVLMMILFVQPIHLWVSSYLLTIVGSGDTHKQTAVISAKEAFDDA